MTVNEGTPPQSIRTRRPLGITWFNRFVIQMGLLWPGEE